MTASEVAREMFTANPANGNRNEILVSAGYGIGGTVDGGLINPDSFTLTRDGHFKGKNLVKKRFSRLKDCLYSVYIYAVL